MMKIFELRWNSKDEKEFIAARTNIEAIKTYLDITSTDIVELEDEDEIIELPREKWKEMTVRNIEYNPKDKDDWEEQTFEDYMKDLKHPDLIAGTMYD